MKSNSFYVYKYKLKILNCFNYRCHGTIISTDIIFVYGVKEFGELMHRAHL